MWRNRLSPRQSLLCYQQLNYARPVGRGYRSIVYELKLQVWGTLNILVNDSFNGIVAVLRKPPLRSSPKKKIRTWPIYSQYHGYQDAGGRICKRTASSRSMQLCKVYSQTTRAVALYRIQALQMGASHMDETCFWHSSQSLSRPILFLFRVNDAPLGCFFLVLVICTSHYNTIAWSEFLSLQVPRETQSCSSARTCSMVGYRLILPGSPCGGANGEVAY